MKKEIQVTKNNGRIVVLLNEKELCQFEISKNKINGKSLLEALNIQKEDEFLLLPHGISQSSKAIDDVVVVNTHLFFQKLIEQINNTLCKYKDEPISNQK